MTRRLRSLAVASTFLAVLPSLSLLPPPAGAARAPVGRQYMVLLLEHHSRPPVLEVTPSCLSFDRDEVCDQNDACGDLVVVEQWQGGNRWQAALEKGSGRDRFELFLSGITETTGADSSIGGVLISTEVGTRNGGFAGVQAPRRACLEFAAAEPDSPPRDCTPPARCCKICRTGKACGDTCIARSRTCNVAPGCACNAADVCP